MRHITLRLDSPKKLAQYLLTDQDPGGIFCASSAKFELGETVIVTICLPDIPEGVALVSKVIWRRRPTQWRSSLVPGIGLAFDEVSRPQVEYLLRHVAGNVSSTRRNWPRHDLELPVEISTGGEVYLSSTRDIGLGGMFVRFDTPCEIGREVDINAFPKGPTKPVEFHGKVAWTRGGAIDPGFGLAFPRTDNELRRRAEQLIIANEPAPFSGKAEGARATVTLWRKPRIETDE
ncbi:MAG: PilZ domain-containing protein [Deltaproteobacteria bacterium]|nr:PilZ domain-containing protein [Deltaproteobacteria bacterium]